MRNGRALRLRFWSDLPGPDRAAWAVVVVGALVGLVLILTTRDDRSPSVASPGGSTRVSTASDATAPDSEGSAGGEGASAGGTKACAAAAAPSTAVPRVTCRTGNAVLTISAPRVPVLVEDIEARILKASFAASNLSVRLRVRNGGTQARRFTPGSRQVYARIGGRRIRSQPAPPQTVPAGNAE